MLDDVAKLLPVVKTPVVVAGAVRVFTGTGISVPDAMIAFLLLLVKTVGREIVRKRPVESSRRTIAESVFPADKKIFVPGVAPVASANWPKFMRLAGSIIGAPVLRDTPPAPR